MTDIKVGDKVKVTSKPAIYEVEVAEVTKEGDLRGEYRYLQPDGTWSPSLSGWFPVKGYEFEVIERPEWQEGDIVLYKSIYTDLHYPMMRNEDGGWDSADIRNDIGSDAHLQQCIDNDRIIVCVKLGKLVERA